MLPCQVLRRICAIAFAAITSVMDAKDILRLRLDFGSRIIFHSSRICPNVLQSMVPAFWLSSGMDCPGFAGCLQRLDRIGGHVPKFQPPARSLQHGLLIPRVVETGFG